MAEGKLFRPMLAYKEVPWDKLRYPVMVSPKLDGVRMIVRDGVCLSRKLIPIPNRHVQRMFSNMEGIDGELLVGDPTAQNAYNVTESAVMSRDGAPSVCFYAFDLVLRHDLRYCLRHSMLKKYVEIVPAAAGIRLVPQLLCHTQAEIEAAETTYIDAGYEGAIVRNIDAYYKYGRSTPNDQVLMKLKRFSQGEARITNVWEAQHNSNMAVSDALGLTKRSSHKAGKIGKGMVGSFEIVDLNHKWRFDCGPGVLTTEERINLWEQRDSLIGKSITYKYFAHGMKDVPRHPGFVGFRDMEVDG